MSLGSFPVDSLPPPNTPPPPPPPPHHHHHHHHHHHAPHTTTTTIAHCTPHATHQHPQPARAPFNLSYSIQHSIQHKRQAWLPAHRTPKQLANERSPKKEKGKRKNDGMVVAICHWPPITSCQLLPILADRFQCEQITPPPPFHVTYPENLPSLLLLPLAGCLCLSVCLSAG